MYSVHKTIKRYLLSLPILAGLVGLSFILQANTSAAQPDTPPSYDYTLQHHPDQVSPIEEEAYLDIEEMPQELTSSAADQKGAHKTATTAVSLLPKQLLIPANGNCLCTTIIMGYLLPVRQDTGKVNTRNPSHCH